MSTRGQRGHERGNELGVLEWGGVDENGERDTPLHSFAAEQGAEVNIHGGIYVHGKAYGLENCPLCSAL